MFEISKPTIQSGMETENLSALTAAAKADPAAFGRLYDRYVQPVYRYIRSRVASEPEAEDLTAQTFMAAFEGLRSYHERGYFSAWLFRIARSKVTDHYRRGRREVPLEEIEDRPGMEEPLGQVVRDDELKRLAGLIRGLGESERELIRFRYVAGLSFAEIAEVLGKREDAVKKSFYRLLANIKGQME